MAGTHQFVVPDDTYAQGLTEALVAHGFARVTARASVRGGWMVIAVDEGPYPADTTGHRMIDAVGREAAVVARRFRGYPEGGGRCHVDMLPVIQGADAAIVCTNPGARPPTPTIMVVPAPRPAPLALTPDHIEDSPVDLSGLNDIAWSDLKHAHGSAEDVPELLRELANPFGDWDQILDELFGDDLLHQGTCYPATAPALPFLTRMLISQAMPAKQRLDLYLRLLSAADRWADSLLVDADRAAAQDRLPMPAPWTEAVHLTVGEQLPALLPRWDIEPPAVRFALASLAGLYPHHGHEIADRITAMAHGFDSSQPGAYLRLAEALAHTRDDEALRISTDIVAWENDHDPGWLDATRLTTAVKAGHILAEGALHVLSSTSQGPGLQRVELRAT
jgi:hypothetical protein